MLFIAVVFSIEAQQSSKKFNALENKIKWPDAFDPSRSDFYVHNEIEISASPEVVWSILVMSSRWNEWYDGIQQIKFEDETKSDLYMGAKVFWRSMGQNLHNTVMQFEPNTALAWQFNESKIQGYHAWLIIPTPDGCKVITDESQTGRLANLQKLFLPNKLLRQHDDWLRKLKERAEYFQNSKATSEVKGSLKFND